MRGWVAFVCLAGCGSPKVCTPGATSACACASGPSGTQTCKGDGSGEGPCLVCRCAPGTQQRCACPFGAWGTQTCENGAFADCQGCPGPPSVAALEKTCAMNVSCLAMPVGGGGGDCVSFLQTILASPPGLLGRPSDYRRYVDCAAAASDCATALDCVSRGHGPDYCERFPGLSCDGDLLVDCPSPPDWSLRNTECAAFGMHCVATAVDAFCSDGGDCHASPACDGNRLLGCAQPRELLGALDCSAVYPKGICTSDEHLAACTIASPACGSAQNALRCAGTTLVSCFEGHEWQRDCALDDALCVGGGPDDWQCLPKETSCDGQSPDRCNGPSLTLCVDGRPQDFDCTTIGLATCKPNGDNAICAN